MDTKGTDGGTTTFTHITKEFQRWTKAEQAQHLREAHGLEVTEADEARRSGGWTSAATTLYQRHCTAHDEEQS